MSRRTRAARADAELDRASRGLPAFVPSMQRSESTRTSLLTLAESEPTPSGSKWPWYAAVAAGVAAAIVLLLLTGRDQKRPSSTSPSLARIDPAPATRFEQLANAPDQVVALTHGRLEIEVARLDAAQRFRVRTDDAVIEVRGTRFRVRADHGKLISVRVEEGRVEVRPDRGAVALLGPGERWELDLGKHSLRRRASGPTPEPAPEPTPLPKRADRDQPMPSTSKPKPRRRARPTKRPGHPASSAMPAPEPTARVEPKPKPDDDAQAATRPHRRLSPGEQAFRDGWRALRQGRHAYAGERLTIACRSHAAIRQDACFWVAVAWKRAGRSSHARRGFSRFLERYPRAPRAGEARAVLGWMLFHKGKLTAAKRLFAKAAHDRVPAVRKSAVKGLEAIKRKRHR